MSTAIVKAAPVDLAPLESKAGQAAIKAYDDVLKLLEALPPGRQRSMAITALEQSFVHAVFASAGLDSPIRMR